MQNLSVCRDILLGLYGTLQCHGSKNYRISSESECYFSTLRHFQCDLVDAQFEMLNKTLLCKAGILKAKCVILNSFFTLTSFIKPIIYLCTSLVPLCNKIALQHTERKGKDAEIIRSHKNTMGVMGLQIKRESEAQREVNSFFFSRWAMNSNFQI